MKQSFDELLESMGLIKLVPITVRSTLHFAPRQKLYIDGIGHCQIHSIIDSTRIRVIRVKARLSILDRIWQTFKKRAQ